MTHVQKVGWIDLEDEEASSSQLSALRILAFNCGTGRVRQHRWCGTDPQSFE